jgi:RNA polymerase sigma-70 factor, ECF subfamily
MDFTESVPGLNPSENLLIFPHNLHTLTTMGILELDTVPDDDGEIVLRIVSSKEGDAPDEAQRLFEVLYRRHGRAVLARLAVSASRSHADDLAQEAWMRAWKRLDSFKTGSFRAWILTIATNCRIDRQRRRSESLLAPDSDVADGSAEIEEDRVEQTERTTVLRDCLSKLDDRRRRVIVGLFYEKTDYEAVCRELGITTNAAYKLTHEAKRILSDCCRRKIQ